MAFSECIKRMYFFAQNAAFTVSRFGQKVLINEYWCKILVTSQENQIHQQKSQSYCKNWLISRKLYFSAIILKNTYFYRLNMTMESSETVEAAENSLKLLELTETGGHQGNPVKNLTETEN